MIFFISGVIIFFPLFIVMIEYDCFCSHIFRSTALEIDYITLFSTIIAILFGIIIPYSIEILQSKSPYPSSIKNGLWLKFIKEKTCFIIASQMAIAFLISLSIHFFLKYNACVALIHFLMFFSLLVYAAWFIDKAFKIVGEDDFQNIKDFMEKALKNSSPNNQNLATPIVDSIIQSAIKFDLDTYNNEKELFSNFFASDQISEDTQKERDKFILNSLYKTNWYVKYDSQGTGGLLVIFIDYLMDKLLDKMTSSKGEILQTKLNRIFKYLLSNLSQKNNELALRNVKEWCFECKGLNLETKWSQYQKSQGSEEDDFYINWCCYSLSFLAALLHKIIFLDSETHEINLKIIEVFNQNKKYFERIKISSNRKPYILFDDNLFNKFYSLNNMEKNIIFNYWDNFIDSSSYSRSSLPPMFYYCIIFYIFWEDEQTDKLKPQLSLREKIVKLKNLSKVRDDSRYGFFPKSCSSKIDQFERVYKEFKKDLEQIPDISG